MIDLQKLQRERRRLYKNDLKQQINKNDINRTRQFNQRKENDSFQMQQRVNFIKQQTLNEKQEAQKIRNAIRDQNLRLSHEKNNNKNKSQFETQQPLKGHSFEQNLQMNQSYRLKQKEETLKQLSKQNYQEQEFHKYNNKNLIVEKSIEQKKHIQRINEIQQLRQKQYQQTKKKHFTQKTNLLLMHTKLNQHNQNYRKSLESFAYDGKDILDTLKRDDTLKITQNRKNNLNSLKYQIQQKQFNKNTEKNIIQNPQYLKQSIFSHVLYKDNSRDMNSYSNYLSQQMRESNLKKNLQKSQNKEKLKIQSIYGGEVGNQRLKMIKYIDRNLGIQSQMMKSIQYPNQRSNSSLQRNYPNHSLNKSMVISHSAYQQNNHNLEQPVDKKQLTSTQTNENSYRNKFENMLNNQDLSNSAPKSYLSYDFIKGSAKRYELM